MSSTANRRLFKEILQLESLGENSFSVKNIDGNAKSHFRLEFLPDFGFRRWAAFLTPMEGSLYHGGVFELRIDIPEAYPISPPSIRFLTKICHPNIHFKTGEICLDILSSAWSPVWTLQSCLFAISLLMDNPEHDSPLNCDAGNLLRCGDLVGFQSLARMYTRIYASPMDSSK
eukprot:Sdes_comp20773_c0_seq1m16807